MAKLTKARELIDAYERAEAAEGTLTKVEAERDAAITEVSKCALPRRPSRDQTRTNTGGYNPQFGPNGVYSRPWPE